MNPGDLIVLFFAVIVLVSGIRWICAAQADPPRHRYPHSPDSEDNTYYSATIPDPEPQTGQGYGRIHYQREERSAADACADAAIARAQARMGR